MYIYTDMYTHTYVRYIIRILLFNSVFHNTILILHVHYTYTYILQNDTRLTKKRDAKDLIKLKTPSQPSDKGPNSSNNEFFFTQYVMKNRAIDQTRIQVSM